MKSERFGLVVGLALACVACSTSTPPPDLYDEILACSSDTACDSGTMPAPGREEVCADLGACDTILWSPYF